MSIIKRIDSLGRIVIPKSVRKSLNIKNSDEVEIECSKDKIIISKYNVVEKNEMFLENIVQVLHNYLPNELYVVITDTNIALNASNLDFKGLKLSSRYLMLLNNRKAFKESIVPSFNPFENYKNMYLKLSFPIIIDSTLCGSIAIVGKRESATMIKEIETLVEYSRDLIIKIMY